MGGVAVEERGDGELELVGVRVAGGGVLGFWGRELVRERGDWVAGLPLVLKCARDGEAGLFPELATATARWRPRSSIGVAWRGGRDPARGGVGPGGCGGAACGSGVVGGGLRPSSAASGAVLRRRQRKQRGRGEGEES